MCITAAVVDGGDVLLWERLYTRMVRGLLFVITLQNHCANVQHKKLHTSCHESGSETEMTWSADTYDKRREGRIPNKPIEQYSIYRYSRGSQTARTRSLVVKLS